MEIGANYLDNGRCKFTIWAPFCTDVSLIIFAPEKQEIPMKREDRGYWHWEGKNVFPGARYSYRLNNKLFRPDPASFFQPEGIHYQSQVIDHKYSWNDYSWSGIPLEEMVIYELHVGTFTKDGTFKAIIPKLDDLCDLGVTALEIMPIGQFPGERNWGYDGVYPFAVQNSYGGPDRFKDLVDACHLRGLAIILDVVYNHFGPEGNYISDFGPYFTEKYKTPWGNAINFDDAYSDEVRNFYFENAYMWLRDYHVDALRLDAVHSIFDMSAKPFLQELAEKVSDFSKISRKRFLIAESDLNDIKTVKTIGEGGQGIDAQWCDDLHHSLHTLLTGEHHGYYEDFGRIEDLVKALREGFVYSWTYSEYRKKHYGNSSLDLLANKFVVCSQNHDQVGNRPFGERLSTLISFEALKLAAGIVMLSPYIPLIFMGEEHAEKSPFLYFISHSDSKVVKAVREGRKRENNDPCEPHDPQDLETFLRSKINWHCRTVGKHKAMFDYYCQLISLRKKIPALINLDKNCLEVQASGKIIFLRRWSGPNRALCIMNFNNANAEFEMEFKEKNWKKALDSSESCWYGPGSMLPESIKNREKLRIRAFSLALYGNQDEEVYD